MHAGADRVRTICCNKYFDNTSPLLVAGVPAVSVYIVIAQPSGRTVDRVDSDARPHLTSCDLM